MPSAQPLKKPYPWPMVNGLFYQDATQQQLCKGIEGLFAGEYWLSRQLVADYLYRTRKKPKPKMPMKAELTKREVQILQLTATEIGRASCGKECRSRGSQYD